MSLNGVMTLTTGSYSSVNGARMWYDVHGDGTPLVLLHGGLSDSRDFDGFLDSLAGHFRVYRTDRRGHGRTADVDGPITAQVMADDLIAFLDRVVGEPARLIGYSAGAVVALMAAVARPDLAERLVLVSGAYHRDGMLIWPSAEGEPPAPLVAAYAEVSPDGAEHFPVLLEKVSRAMTEEPWLDAAQLSAVTCPTLIMAGDDDLVTHEHTLELYRGIPNSELAIIPRTSHLLLYEKPSLCAGVITDFLTTEPAATLMPIRRAAAGRS